MSEGSTNNVKTIDDSVLNALNRSTSLVEAREYECLEDKVNNLAMQKFQLEILSEMWPKLIDNVINGDFKEEFNVFNMFVDQLHNEMNKMSQSKDGDESISQLISEISISPCYFEDVQSKFELLATLLKNRELVAEDDKAELLFNELNEVSKIRMLQGDSSKEEIDMIELNKDTISKLGVKSDEVYRIDERLQRIEESLEKLTQNKTHKDYIFEENQGLSALRSSHQKIKELKNLMENESIILNRATKHDINSKSEEENMRKQIFSLLDGIQESMEIAGKKDLERTPPKTGNNMQSLDIFFSKVWEEIKGLKDEFVKHRESITEDEYLKFTFQKKAKEQEDDVEAIPQERQVINKQLFQSNTPIAQRNKAPSEALGRFSSDVIISDGDAQHGNLRQILKEVVGEALDERLPKHFASRSEQVENPALSWSNDLHMIQKIFDSSLQRFSHNVLENRFVLNKDLYKEEDRYSNVEPIKNWLASKLVLHPPQGVETENSKTGREIFNNTLLGQLSELFSNLLGKDVIK